MSTYVHFVTFKADGLPQAGLSPTAKARGAGGVDLSGSMAIAEVGDGIYSVTYTYTTAVPCRAVINAGTDVIDNRSIDVDFTLAELNGAASAVQTADNNVILADATKGLAKVYDAMARADAVGPSLSTITSTMALDSTVAKEATLTTKIPTALSFTGANVNAESKVTAAPADMATASNQADILEAIAAVPAAPSAAAIDTQLSGTHGSGIWGASGGGGANQVTITVTTPDDAPIPQVKVTVRDRSDTVSLAQAETDSNGEAIVALDDGYYLVRLMKFGYEFVVPEELTVVLDTEETYEGEAITESPPTAGCQTVKGYLVLANNAGASGHVVSAQVLEKNTDISHSLLSLQKLSVTLDASGYYELTLIKGLTYNIQGCTAAGDLCFSKTVLITADDSRWLTEYA